MVKLLSVLWRSTKMPEHDMEAKSWLEVEMDESIALIRKKLEELNDIHPDHLDNNDILMMKNLYKTMYYIKSIKASMGK